MDLTLFESVYEDMQPRIRAYLYRRVRNLETADDLAQEVFMRAWMHWEAFEDRGIPADTWLYTIAKNIAVDYWRKGATKIVSASTPFSLPGPAVPEEDIALHMDIVSALAQLPSRERYAMAAMLYVGDNGKEAGKLLGVTSTVVRKRAWSARRKLLASVDR